MERVIFLHQLDIQPLENLKCVFYPYKITLRFSQCMIIYEQNSSREMFDL